MSEAKNNPMTDIWDEAMSAGSPGYARIAMLGRAGSGKTFSGIMLALELRKLFGLTGPIGALDTENGFDYLRDIVLEVTGQPLLIVKTRNLDKWCEAIQRAADRGNMVLIGDSVSHVWKQLCDGYLRQLQDRARAKNWKKIPTDLEFKDWNPIKQQWSIFADLFMNAPVHQIMCGREGSVWAMETNERGQKELQRKDAKMKAEGEFEYEASLSLLFEKHRDNPESPIVHRVTVRKDRADRIMGHEFTFIPGKTPPRAICDFVRPHFESLHPQAYTPTDTTGEHDFALDAMGNDDRTRRDQDRAILLEKIQNELVRRHPSTSGADKKAKLALLDTVFGTSSWTEMEKRTPLSKLRTGLEQLASMGEP